MLPSSTRRSSQQELGDFLRSRRQRLTPDQVGLAKAARRRRTAGLRREEVAELAGIGVDWYVRLEQGRAVSPSPTTVEALARALRLSPVEHGHLRSLARPADRPPFALEMVSPTTARIVGALKEPAYVTGRRWDVLAWNQAADAIFGFSAKPEAERNTLLSVLTDPASRALFREQWAQVARHMVEQFRAAHDLWAGDPAFDGLLGRLREGCPEFEHWWAAHDVRGAPAGRKTLHHPRLGVLHFEHASFQSNDDPMLRLVIYSPV